MNPYPEAPESVKYHGGYDPADPPQDHEDSIWCSDCGEWIEEPCEHQHPDPDELIQIQEAQDRKLDAPRSPL